MVAGLPIIGSSNQTQPATISIGTETVAITDIGMIMKGTIAHLNPQEFLTIHNEQICTTSLKVAEAFGKQHKDVLRKLESLDCSPEYRQRNFTQTVYHRENPSAGKPISAPMYEMTKDGFMFLVMGFTGKKAAAIKEAYINAFNWMADQLQQQHHQPQQISIPTYSLPQLPPHQIIVNRQDLVNLLHMTGMTRDRWRAMEQANEELVRAQNTMRAAIGHLHDCVKDTTFHEIPLQRAL